MSSSPVSYHEIGIGNYTLCPIHPEINLLIASWSGFWGNKWANNGLFSSNISNWFHTGQERSTELEDMTAAAPCFDTGKFYSLVTLCDFWVKIVAALLPLHTTYIAALANFFSKMEDFSFQRSIVSQNFCITFLEALTPFSHFLYFDTEIVINTRSVLLGVFAKSEEWHGCSTSLSTVLGVLQPAYGDSFTINDLLSIDLNLLEASPLSSHLRPIDNVRCLKIVLLLLSGFPWNKDVFLSQACRISHGLLPSFLVKKRRSERQYRSASSWSLLRSGQFIAVWDALKHFCSAFLLFRSKGTTSLLHLMNEGCCSMQDVWQLSRYSSARYW